MAGPVIITRAEPGNSQTISRLAADGLACIAAPMLEIVPTGERLPFLETFQGLLFTSANGVRAFCEASPARDLTAWCVGPATFTEAEEAGFTSLEHADGNADDLAALVMQKAAPEEALLHVANAAAAGNIAERLRKAGFRVMFAPLYRADAASRLPEAAFKALESSQTCTVLVHSAKGAASFASVMPDLDVSHHLVVAVSQTAAGPLVGRGFGHVCWADRPNEAALTEALLKAHSKF